MNTAEFYKHITNLPDKFENRDLEEYLLALLKLIEMNRTKEVTYKLILEIISEAFTSEPYAFKNEWLKCETAPDENRMSRKFTHPDISEAIDKTNTSDLTTYDFTIEVLRFQIAELHKMRGKQLENEYRFFGVQSETGNSWYNFDPFANLECGARCMEDNETDFSSLDWSFIGELLENGRIYE
ncbi:hypothetical protein R9C00_14345 [Flammeovirgaceae bacterium SG7u.111]|nr:hypothetical protein [Flammeovirgaceae bacterium SG7u.132]WPO38637.1 hypothetical protein R9C00_14345 [Flammeovirgaceae bacterium SG7u.111]